MVDLLHLEADLENQGALRLDLQVALEEAMDNLSEARPVTQVEGALAGNRVAAVMEDLLHLEADLANQRALPSDLLEVDMDNQGLLALPPSPSVRENSKNRQ